MPRLHLTRQFEHVEVPDHVGTGIGVRMVERTTHSGLRAEMDDAVKTVSRGEAIERGLVGEIDLLEGEAIAMIGLQRVEPRVLQPWVVIIAEIVDADDSLAARKQRSSG